MRAPARAQSKARLLLHQEFHAMSPASSTATTRPNIGVKSRPDWSRSQPVKYWPHAPVRTARTEVEP